MKHRKQKLLQNNSPPITIFVRNYKLLKHIKKMKTFKLFIGFTILSFLTSNAQITKGNWMMGGNLKFSKSKSEFTSNNNTQIQEGSGLNLTSNIGYFPIDKFAVGLTPSFVFNNPEGSNNNSIGYGIGPFVRYYFLKVENRINLFSQVEYQYGNGYSNGKKTSNNKNYNFRVGPSIFFNSSVALEFTLEYQLSDNNYLSGSGSQSKFTNFNIGVGFQIHLEK